MRTTALYNVLRRHGKFATIITRTTTINRVTGVPESTENRWSGDVGFVENVRLPREANVVVADAWVLTDRLIQDKSEIHCNGKAYRVLRLAQFDMYNVAALKAAGPSEVHRELNSYQSMAADIAETPSGHLWQQFADTQQHVDVISGFFDDQGGSGIP